VEDGWRRKATITSLAGVAKPGPEIRFGKQAGPGQARKGKLAVRPGATLRVGSRRNQSRNNRRRTLVAKWSRQKRKPGLQAGPIPAKDHSSFSQARCHVLQLVIPTVRTLRVGTLNQDCEAYLLRFVAMRCRGKDSRSIRNTYSFG